LWKVKRIYGRGRILLKGGRSGGDEVVMVEFEEKK